MKEYVGRWLVEAVEDDDGHLTVALSHEDGTKVVCCEVDIAADEQKVELQMKAAHRKASTKHAKPPSSVRSDDWFGEFVLAVDLFAACIETGVLPTHGSPCHRMARRLVKDSGIPPHRKRRRLPPNDKAQLRSEVE
jgi:hypothetical protein